MPTSAVIKITKGRKDMRRVFGTLVLVLLANNPASAGEQLDKAALKELRSLEGDLDRLRSP
jgi:hypothetical protein